MTMLSSIGRATAHIVELDYSTSSSLAPIGPEQGVTFGGYELGIRTLVSFFRFRSSAAEQTTVNRSVPGSIPGETAIFHTLVVQSLDSKSLPSMQVSP